MAKHKKSARKKKFTFNFNAALTLLLIIALLAILKEISSPIGNLESDLADEAQVVLNKLTASNSDMSLITSDGITDERVSKLESMEYDYVKGMLGVKSEFCVYVEDIDGNIVKIDNKDKVIGSDKIHINGKPCR
jgi:hypothetical protein